MKRISVVTPCFNEESNVNEVYRQVKGVFQEFPKYHYEHIFIDNASTDKTVSVLKEIAEKDKNVKVIVNAGNFGHIRSPYYGMLQAQGDAVISIVADLQDPPAMIREFIRYWEEGFKIVIGIKNKSEENPLVFFFRKVFYLMIKKISETNHIDNFTGFGLYDQSFIDLLRHLKEPYPYFRGLIAELGFQRKEIPYVQPRRKKGKSSHSLYSLYDTAMLGFVNHSKVPLRLASFIGFGVGLISLLVAAGYFVYKLIFWDEFVLGTAPLVIGLFFFSSVQLFFIGIIGEYIGAIYTQVKNHPLVVEKERINFD